MKPIEFIGRTLKTIKGFPVQVVHEIGHELDRVQLKKMLPGNMP